MVFFFFNYMYSAEKAMAASRAALNGGIDVVSLESVY